MLYIVLEEQGRKLEPPALLQPISQEMFCSPCSSLLPLCLTHFKSSISPLIRQEHLCLYMGNKRLHLDYPLFIYLSSTSFVNTIICSISA